MSKSTLPVDGWVDTCASYGVTIMRALVTEIRDQGPLMPEQAKAIIRRVGIGADVSKASPSFDLHDGADRILNLFLSDVDVVTQRPDGELYIAPEITTAHSKIKRLTLSIETAAMQEAARDVAYRRTHLRRWLDQRPFQSVWRDGIVKHSEEEVVNMADLIREVGYHSAFPIIQDQSGLVIDGHLRLAALAKLGIDPKPYIQTKSFANDVERLAWYLAGHCYNGKWSVAIRDSVFRVVNGAAKRSNVKMQWPQDIAIVVGQFDVIAAVSPPELVPVPQPKPTQPPLAQRTYTDQLPRAGSQIAQVMLTLLQTGKPVNIGALGVNSSSVTYRARQQGWMVYDGVMASLTEKGVVIAKKVWRRDRGGRDVPTYDSQTSATVDEPVTGIASLAGDTDVV